jgi:PHP family Zn ribbon phosphoesterase
MGRGVGTEGVRATYLDLIARLGDDIQVLEVASLDVIADAVGEQVAEAVGWVRRGNVAISPGYDGVYGRLGIWPAS